MTDNITKHLAQSVQIDSLEIIKELSRFEKDKSKD